MGYKTIKRPIVGVAFLWFAIWLYPNSLMYGTLPGNIRLDDLFVFFTFLVALAKSRVNTSIFSSNVFNLSLIWWFIHLLANINGSLYLGSGFSFAETFKFLLKAAYVPITAAIIFHLVNSKEDIKYCLKWILVAGTCTAIIGIGTVIYPEYFKIFLIPDLELGDAGLLEKIQDKLELARRASGSLGIVSTSIICTFTSSLALYSFVSEKELLFKKRTILIILVISLLGLFFTQSRGPILALCIAATYLLLRSKNKITGILAIGAILIAVFTIKPIGDLVMERFSGNSGSDLSSGLDVRSDIWELLINKIDKGLLINGIGMVPLKNLFNATAHNTYLGALIYGGIWGVMWFIAIIIKTFKSSRNLLKMKSDVLGTFLGGYLIILLIFMLIIGISIENFQQTISMQIYMTMLLLGEKILLKKKYLNKINQYGV